MEISKGGKAIIFLGMVYIRPFSDTWAAALMILSALSIHLKLSIRFGKYTPSTECTSQVVHH